MLWMINLLKEILCFNSDFASSGMEESSLFNSYVQLEIRGFIRGCDLQTFTDRDRLEPKLLYSSPSDPPYISEKVVPDSTRMYTWLDSFIIYLFSSRSDWLSKRLEKSIKSREPTVFQHLRTLGETPPPAFSTLWETRHCNCCENRRKIGRKRTHSEKTLRSFPAILASVTIAQAAVSVHCIARGTILSVRIRSRSRGNDGLS